MRRYSADIKASVIADLQLGESVPALSRKYSIPRTTISNWRDQAGLLVSVGNEKKDEIGALVLEYIRESVRTLSAQARHFRDPVWLKKQGAGEIYLVHGVLADKAIKILAALERAEEQRCGDGQAEGCG